MVRFSGVWWREGGERDERGLVGVGWGGVHQEATAAGSGKVTRSGWGGGRGVGAPVGTPMTEWSSGI